MASHGKTAANRLLEAASSGNLKLLKKLGKELDDGKGVRKALMEVRDSENGRGVLHFAAAGGRTHVCKYLIEELELDVNEKDKNGDSPLHITVMEDKYLTSAYILDHGALPNMAGQKGLTALHYAAEKGRKNQLHLLISKGAEVDAESFKGTPLLCAATNSMRDAVKILLDNHANPNSIAHHIYSPLMFAIQTNSVENVKLLLKFAYALQGGADPNLGVAGFKAGLSGSRGATPLIMAASKGETAIIKCLLEAGADPNVTNFYDLTPIEIAAISGSFAAVKVLFPASKRISSIPNWSCDGIIEYLHSDEAKNQRKLKTEEKYLEAKQKGTDAVGRSDYLDAIFWYTEAICAKPADATLFSNRSLCRERLNEGDFAIMDALSCIMLRPDWAKGYYRAGMAFKILRDPKNALDAFGRAVLLDPENIELQEALREAKADLRAELMRDLGVGGLCSMLSLAPIDLVEK